MQPITEPHVAPGRRGWRLFGLLSLLVLIVPATLVIVFRAGHHPDGTQTEAVPAHTIAVPETVTNVNVTSYGAPIKVVRRAGGPVTVTQEITYAAGTLPPLVRRHVGGSTLTLQAPACEDGNCAVAFTVTVPLAVTVTAASEGGDIQVSGVAAATLDSGGGAVTASQVQGPLKVNSEGGDIVATATKAVNIDSGGGMVTATGVDGPLSAHTDGGPLSLTGLAGSFTADTGGGPVTGTGLSAPSSLVSTEGGPAVLDYRTAPRTVQVDTGGGPAAVKLPGGPYLVRAESDSIPPQISVPTSPSAPRTVSVLTEGGPLEVTPAAGG